METPTHHWAEALTGWESWMRSADRPETTIYLRTYQVARFARTHPDPWTVTLDDMAAWLGSWTWSTETRRSYRAGLRAFYDYGQATGRCTTNPAALLPTIAPPAGQPRPTPAAVVTDALLRANDRERLMILLATHAGLRRAEVAAVHTSDVERDLLGWSLRVDGKGRKIRRVPLTDDLTRLLLDSPPGWVFPSTHGGHLTPAHVGKLVSRLLGPGWTTHTLRHRFATAAYAGRGDLLSVSALLGHAKPETTRRYVLLPDHALRAAVLAAAA